MRKKKKISEIRERIRRRERKEKKEEKGKEKRRELEEMSYKCKVYALDDFVRNNDFEIN
jgi:hypothetical protein